MNPQALAIDTSALLAILFDEPPAIACNHALAAATVPMISAGTLAEARIVAVNRGCADAMEELLTMIAPEVVAVTSDTTRLMAAAYAAWGKGRHPAGLNFGDCFAYVLARARDCPLLFIGDDFARTDVTSALAR